MENQLLFVLILWLLVMYFVESTKQKLWKKTKKELKGVPINELSDNMIYHQCPSPGALVFLFEGDEIEPKVYFLDIDAVKLPNSFMSIENGKKIVPWNFIDLYKNPKEEPDLLAGIDDRTLSEEDVLELKDLAGKH